MQIDLSAHGYRQASSPGLWVPAGDDGADFAYNDGDAHEMWVGSAVRSATDVSTHSRELQRGIKDWPSLYHLSPMRGNLVRPLLDSMTGPVLEIGAGMGAITRALGEHGLDVLAVEGSPRRAAICADRCRDLDNVRVVADNFQNLGTDDKFGTIVMIGVLEYSRVFFDDGSDLDPVDAMLRHVVSMLAPGGQFVLAIENQLGLKYLAGFPEDHVGRRMFGVEDRYGAETVVTFGREELRRRLGAVGLDQQEWFFPFPDYKLPTTVLSEHAFDVGSPFDSAPLVAPTSRDDHQHPGTIAFDIERAWPVVERNGLVPDLANSFLVRGSATPLAAASSTTVAWYFGSGARRPEFAKTTTFEIADGAMWVRRRPVLDGLPAAIGSTRLVLEDEQYHSGRPWTEALAGLIGRAGWDVDALAAWFGTWLDAFRSFAAHDADDATGGSVDLVPGRMLDAMPRNLVVDGESAKFIDLEWVSSEPVPVTYAVFRALYDSLASRGTVAAPAEGTPLIFRDLISEIAARHGIGLDPASISAHWEREREFQSTVLGSAVELSEDDALGAALSLHRDLDSVFADAAQLRESIDGGDGGGGPRDKGAVLEVELREEIERRGEALSVMTAVEAELREEIDRRGDALSRMQAVEAQLREEITRRGDAVSHLAALEAGLRDELGRRGADLDRARADQVELGRALGRLEREASTAREDSSQQLEKGRLHIAALESALRSAAGEVETLVAAQAAIQSTLSWRVTQPLRAVRSLPSRATRRVATAPPQDGSDPAGADAPSLAASPTSVAAPVPDVAEDFDVDYYRRRNNDLHHLDVDGLYRHYVNHGQAENRRGRSALSRSSVTTRSMDATRETILLLLHDATRTGAPVLGWNLARELGDRYNVVVVLLAGGELQEEIELIAAATVALDGETDPTDALLLGEDLSRLFSPVYAIANSAATHPLAPAFERSGIPVVALIHEFASSVRPHGVLQEFLATVSEVVFPAQIVADSMRREYTELIARTPRTIAQGQSTIPPGNAESAVARATPLGPDGVDADLPEISLDELLAVLDADTVLVIGAGTIAPRKGVEFFIQAACEVRQLSPGAKVKFAWIGHRFGFLQWYVEELWEQVVRSGVGEGMSFVGPSSDLASLFDRADVFFLSSRLDPLPNVTIDAALAGVPVVAFDAASGFADWMLEDEQGAALVVPHLDSAAAARAIAALVDDPQRRERLGAAIQRQARESFDFARYARRIDDLGRSARRAAEQARADVAEIEASGTFGYLSYGGSGATATPVEMVADYVHHSRIAVPRAAARTGLIVRRPREGFHPLVYAEQAPGYDEERDGDPFADFLRKGEPDGPWSHRVLHPQDDLAAGSEPSLRTLVHGHFHYPELVGDLLARLAGNVTPFDLHLTTSTSEKARILESTCAEHGFVDAMVSVVDNRGRNVAPLLTGLGLETVKDYELLLHVHGKRSPHVDSGIAERWRDFLWENLVGGRAPMMDRIHSAFVTDPTLGLVFPEDSNLNDWDLNRSAADALAARLGVALPFTTHFDFPVGTMFWARTRAIQRLFDARLAWDEYPSEPLPIDGSMLHALERVIPFVVAESGHSYATTSVPGVER